MNSDATEYVYCVDGYALSRVIHSIQYEIFIWKYLASY
jgi:hypothetical protein